MMQNNAIIFILLFNYKLLFHHFVYREVRDNSFKDIILCNNNSI